MIAKLLEETGLAEVEVTEGDRSIRVVRNGIAAAGTPMAPAPAPVAAVCGTLPLHAGAVRSKDWRLKWGLSSTCANDALNVRPPDGHRNALFGWLLHSLLHNFLGKTWISV